MDVSLTFHWLFRWRFIMKDRKEYFKAYYQEHKEERKAYQKAYQNAYYKEHKEERKAYQKAYQKAYYKEHKEEKKAYQNAYRKSHKDYFKNYHKADVNSLGKPKDSIRCQSNQYLHRHGTVIPGYQIHHCFTYDDPKKFIYCPIKLHIEIHKFLDENGIKADTNHYEQIKHLLDDTVIVYGV